MVALGKSAPDSPLKCRKNHLPPASFLSTFCFVSSEKVREPAPLSSSKVFTDKETLHYCFFFSTLLIVICTNDAHHAEGHDLHQDLCRRSSLPHHRFKSQEIFWGVWWDWRSGGHHRQTDRQVEGLWLRKYPALNAESPAFTQNALFTHVEAGNHASSFEAPFAFSPLRLIACSLQSRDA